MYMELRSSAVHRYIKPSLSSGYLETFQISVLGAFSMSSGTDLESRLYEWNLSIFQVFSSNTVAARCCWSKQVQHPCKSKWSCHPPARLLIEARIWWKLQKGNESAYWCCSKLLMLSFSCIVCFMLCSIFLEQDPCWSSSPNRWDSWWKAYVALQVALQCYRGGNPKLHCTSDTKRKPQSDCCNYIKLDFILVSAGICVYVR